MPSNAIALFPPFDPEADWQYTGFKVFIGAAKPDLQRATISEGWPIVTTASTTLAQIWNDGFDTLTLTSGAAFTTRSGFVYIPGVTSDNMFSYTSRTGNVLFGVRRVGGNDTQLNVGASVYAWRDITGFITRIRRGFNKSGNAYLHYADLEGYSWNSLIVFQDATVYIQCQYENSTFPGNRTPWIPRFLGYLDPPRPTAANDGSVYTVTARCESKWLSTIQVLPQTIGDETIDGDRTVSSFKQNPFAIPGEGDGSSSLDADATKGDRTTLWASGGTPVQAAGLADRPQGRVTVPGGGIPSDADGFGARIQGVYCNPPNGTRYTAQRQKFIEITHTGPNPNRTPYIDDIRSNYVETSPGVWEWITTVIPATEDAETAGILDLSSMTLATKSCRIQLGSKNGYGLGEMALARGQTAIICYNKAVFDENFQPPPNCMIIEIEQCDGWRMGLDPLQWHRGVGQDFDIDPEGDFVALIRQGRGPFQWASREGAGTPRVNIVYDGTNPDLNLSYLYAQNPGDIDTTPITGFPPRGYLTFPTAGVRMYYDGIDTAHQKFLRVRKFGNQNRVFGDVYEGVFTAHWQDFIGISDETRGQIPARFWRKVGDDAPIEDQNQTSQEAHRVWGDRSSGGTGGFNPNAKISVNGPGPGQYLRRKNALGGGVYEGLTGPTYPEDGATFWWHDSATRWDWETLNSPVFWTGGGMETVEWLRIDLGYHNVAAVDDDLTSTILPGNAYPERRITTVLGAAMEYPAALPIERGYLQSTTGVRFTYGRRDRFGFYEVTKYASNGNVFPAGQGPTIDVGEELYGVYNTNPSHHYGAPRPFELGNLYEVASLDIRRWRAGFEATIIEDRMAIEPERMIRCTPGSLHKFPSAGTIYGQFAGTKFEISYDARTADTFYECAHVHAKLRGQIPAGTTVSMQLGDMVVPKSFLVRATRRNNPNDPLTYLENGTNPDWDNIADVQGNTHPNVTVNFANLAGANLYKEIIVIVREMSDGSSPAMINDAIVRRVPRVEPKSSAIAARWANVAVASAGDIVALLLEQVGYDQYHVKAGGGYGIRTLRVGQGSVWAVLDELAGNTDCYLSDGPLGNVTFWPDIRFPGSGRFNVIPSFHITDAALWSDISMEERPHHQRSQIEVIATNQTNDETYTVRVPPIPLRHGTKETITGLFATSETNAGNRAAYRLLRANGGMLLTFQSGHIDQIDPQEILRLSTTRLDTAGRYFSGNVIVESASWDMTADGQTSEFTVEDLISY